MDEAPSLKNMPETEASGTRFVHQLSHVTLLAQSSPISHENVDLRRLSEDEIRELLADGILDVIFQQDVQVSPCSCKVPRGQGRFGPCGWPGGSSLTVLHAFSQTGECAVKIYSENSVPQYSATELREVESKIKELNSDLFVRGRFVENGVRLASGPIHIQRNIAVMEGGKRNGAIRIQTLQSLIESADRPVLARLLPHIRRAFLPAETASE